MTTSAACICATFDWALKGVDNGEASAPPVQIFAMGGGGGYRTSSGRLFHGGHWRDEAEWPLARTNYTKYYLHGDGTLSPEEPAADGGDTVYRFDPANPVPSIGGNVSSLSEIGPLPPGVGTSANAPWRARVGAIDGAGRVRSGGGAGVLRLCAALPAASARGRMCWSSSLGR